jgi:hypothetical protein
VWIIFLNSNGTVKGQQKISDTQGSFGGTLDNATTSAQRSPRSEISTAAAWLILRLERLSTTTPGLDRGAVWILFLKTDGTVNSEAKISDLTAGLAGSLGDSDSFGAAVARLDDLNNDSVADWR